VTLVIVASPESRMENGRILAPRGYGAADLLLEGGDMKTKNPVAAAPIRAVLYRRSRGGALVLAALLCAGPEYGPWGRGSPPERRRSGPASRLPKMPPP
jgi:hypothetical protein